MDVIIDRDTALAALQAVNSQIRAIQNERNEFVRDVATSTRLPKLEQTRDALRAAIANV